MPAVVVDMSWSPDNHMVTDSIETETEEDDGADLGRREHQIPATKGSILLILKNGDIFHAIVPAVSDVDTAVSFKLTHQQCNLSPWKLADSNPDETARRRHAREQERAKADKEEKTEDGTSGAKEGDGGDNGAKAGNIEEPANKVEAPPSGDVEQDLYEDLDVLDAVPTNVWYLDGGYFLLAFKTVAGQGELRSCKFSSPGQSR
ncbi:hypothetical protein M427DRAFT_252345 [Gonapodya prolifera JEL478]|uniref:Uncharacterized protein n=1 Tax=Gonapodya prolifera (strain JEL478) TaxID=1344416 RepID=A0A139ALB7_GONPJ|nr:hypothetical protein M427DRAFT_252345 [Gonapodya prolifera JEL478]|eukprot:KXS17488.1 hypothetical protein M427DRAFT_252345 [Gonapodya prolifera JEL478]